MVKTIPLTQGYVTLLDDEDFERFGQFKWRASDVHTNGVVYAVRQLPKVLGERVIYLHRVILGLPAGRVPEVDHIDLDGLNNQRANLRVVTRSQNLANTRKQSAALTSRFKGVSRFRGTGAWRASISIDGHQYNLGHYVSEEDAARVYDAAARAAWGDHARVNFPDGALPLPTRLGNRSSWTHCKYGHPFDADNTLIRPNGYRLCRICDRERSKKHTAVARERRLQARLSALPRMCLGEKGSELDEVQSGAAQ